MLVLSRKRSEQIVIGDRIRITVVRVDGCQVRLGIEAPEDQMVLRAELIDRPGNGQAGSGPTRGSKPS